MTKLPQIYSIQEDRRIIMSGLFTTFNIVKRGMSAQQTSLHITGHNVANANTEGYSVQKANLKTTQPFGMPSLNTSAEPGQLGTGVQVASITRARDEFLDGQIRKESGTLGKFEAREQFLSEIETIFMEPSDTGLSTTLGRFWDSWSQLSNTPEPNSTARTLVVQNGDALAKSINHTYGQLEDLETNAGELMRQQIFEVNSIMDQIAELNTQIKAVVIGGKTPNDLMDRRDMLLDQLSGRFGFEVDKTEFDGISIKAKVLEDGNIKRKEILTDGRVNQGIAYINKLDLDKNEIELYIDGDPNKPINLKVDDASKFKDIHTVFYNKESYKNNTLKSDRIMQASFESGSLNGYESIKNDVNQYKNELNNIARVLAISVNTLHSNSTDIEDTANINFFNIAAENSNEPAKIIAINDALLKDPKLINAGRDIGIDASEGNGERALLIHSLRYIRINITSIKDREAFLKDVKLDLNTSPMSMKGNPNGITLDNYFKSTIADLGVTNQDAKRNVTNQEALLNQLVSRRESISGVSLDEEMTNMIQFSRAYQANARMISVIDELLNVVVNGLIR